MFNVKRLAFSLVPFSFESLRDALCLLGGKNEAPADCLDSLLLILYSKHKDTMIFYTIINARCSDTICKRTLLIVYYDYRII